MPELPEVETIRRGLNKFIVKKRIKNVEVFCEKSFIGLHETASSEHPESFDPAADSRGSIAPNPTVDPRNIILGQCVKSLDRRGKALLVYLENGICMMIHLRMTGQLIFRSSAKSKHDFADGEIATETEFAGGHPSDNFLDDLPNKQTRVMFEFDDDSKLFFNDQRKFGFIKLISAAEVEDDPFIKKLAPEPWNITPEQFAKNLSRHKNSCIKAAILDQTVITGVGNIYADEALFASRIHPERLVSSLTGLAGSGSVHSQEFRAPETSEVATLLKNITAVMDASIASGGSTMATYVRADGTKGDYLELFAKVFRREGQPCVNCGTKISKIRVAGRGTHICSNCQTKEPR